MNTHRVNTAAGVIARAMENGRQTPAGWAMALDAACMLQSPETAAELEGMRTRLAEHDASPLGWARLLDAKSLDNFMCALSMAADTDPAEGALSQVEEMVRSFREAVPAGAEEERARTLHEHVIARDEEIERLRKQVAVLEAAPTTVYRAEHPDSGITLGHYGTEAAARAHCEATERRSWPTGTTLAFDWIEDDEDRVAELVVTAGQNEESTTGYIVTALELASEYDEEADE